MPWNKTEWSPFFVLLPRKIEGQWVWLRRAYWREDDMGAWTSILGPQGVEYRL